LENGEHQHQERAPLFEKLVQYRGEGRISFHVPGHKSGREVDPQARGLMESVMSIDMTEISGLDDLYHAEGVIGQAQQLAAECFGAEETHFLVGGSTAGNLAMILAVCRRGDLLLVQRNVHKSVIHGLMLAGARAVFLPSRIDRGTGIATAPAPEDVERALAAYPGARGLLVTTPNYYGMGVDLGPLARLVHERGLPLLVDEAHGAHYGFHPALPRPAIACGADAVVQSTHKMLTALTMGAMLHVRGPRIPRALLRQRIAMVQSSSPSYPIMASLDLCRRQLHLGGAGAFERGLAAAAELRRGLRELPGFALCGDTAPAAAYETKDPFKVLVRDATGTLSGTALQAELERDGCMIELADPAHVLLVFSLASTPGDTRRLLASFRRIHAEYGLDGKPAAPPPVSGAFPEDRRLSPPVELPMDMPVAFPSPGQPGVCRVPLEAATGRISAEMVIPYPPGIPILYPGEPVSAETVDYLDRLLTAGSRLQGRDRQEGRTLCVYAGQA
jgi:arginine/lysine/ornithine decarboxylase